MGPLRFFRGELFCIGHGSVAAVRKGGNRPFARGQLYASSPSNASSIPAGEPPTRGPSYRRNIRQRVAADGGWSLFGLRFAALPRRQLRRAGQARGHGGGARGLCSRDHRRRLSLCKQGRVPMLSPGLEPSFSPSFFGLGSATSFTAHPVQHYWPLAFTLPVTTSAATAVAAWIRGLGDSPAPGAGSGLVSPHAHACMHACTWGAAQPRLQDLHPTPAPDLPGPLRLRRGIPFWSRPAGEAQRAAPLPRSGWESLQQRWQRGRQRC